MHLQSYLSLYEFFLQSLISSTDLNWFLGAEGEVEGVGGAVEGEEVGGGG